MKTITRRTTIVLPGAAASPRRRPKPAPAPEGLANAFKLIAMDGYAAHASKQEASGAYPHAVRIIDALHGVDTRPDETDIRGNDLLISRELQDAARSMYPKSNDREPDPGDVAPIVGMAAFQTGFAVCWLLLNSINGGAR